MIYIYAIAIVLVIGAVAITGMLRDRPRGLSAEQKNELKTLRKNNVLAENALRKIAAGDGMPVLTASDALDKINDNYLKEIQ